MKQVLLQQGQATVQEVPAPLLQKGTVLVAVQNSCISSGTELSSMTMSGEPLWRRALKQPDNVKKVLQMAASSGFKKTASMVKGRLQAGAPTGYSAAGIVVAVSEEINDIQIGDRVACAGAQCANHAEVICVPRNLCVSIPESVSFEEASTVTLGAIALQGIRRASPTLGENFLVIGLGILGQLTVQMLRANGCRVIGMDLDKNRIETALSLGLNVAIKPDESDPIAAVYRQTEGIGADGVIITAATPDHSVISTAFNACRKKGRVILVGDVGLDLKRSDIYKKELDFYVSCSYGPGRYDESYEEQGLDYPVSYVRWTENRNMHAYLQLISDEKIKLNALISAHYPIAEAPKAYASLKASAEKIKPLLLLLDYPENKTTNQYLDKQKNYIVKNHQEKASAKKIRLAIIGAGGFAKGMHLPNIEKLSKHYHLQAVCTRNGPNAVATAKQFNANYSTTDFQAICDDPEIDAVLITTRHDTHSNMTLRALKAGKHVLVEKPLAMTQTELDEIKKFFDDYSSNQIPPMLLVGFNRRFSKYAQAIKQATEQRSNPMIINYRMNAGYIPLEHWVHGPQGGGRNIGEACHIYDLFSFLTNSRVVETNAYAINPKNDYYTRNDNFIASFKFEDGSLATLTYTALGNKEHPKESMEVYVDGKVFVMDDYKSLKVCGAKTKSLSSNLPEKGQKEEIKDFAEALLKGAEWPIPLWQMIQATQMSLEVEKQFSLSSLSAQFKIDKTSKETVDSNEREVS